ncbi:MAG: transcriptional regulator with XRE-family HTH domain [Kiritimatiellia bacterium]|jgi:transcriptional regulator with XRE-family HTH domain
MDIKAQRKALGWSRAELASRAGINSPVLGLIERGQWDEPDALTRVAHVLAKASEGDTDVFLAPPTKD